MRCGITIALLVLAALHPAPASACSRICGERFAPLGNDAYPAHLPSNGVFVRPPRESGDVVSVVIVRGDVEETREIPNGEIVEVPDVEVGDRIRLTVQLECGPRFFESTVVEVTAAAALPTALGQLALEPSRRTIIEVLDDGGSCTTDLPVSVAPFEITLDEALGPWRDALEQTVVVDDDPWVEARDPAVDRRFVYAACETPTTRQHPTDLPLGAHRLRLEGRLRGVGPVLVSNEEPFVLGCDIPPGTDAYIQSDAADAFELGDAGASRSGDSDMRPPGASCSASRRTASLELPLAVAAIAVVVRAAKRRAARKLS